MPIEKPYRTPRGLTDDMRRALATQREVVLATINDDSTPHLTEVWFLLDEEDRVLMPTPHDTRKFKNLQKRPQASVIFTGVRGWISATGAVELWTGEKAAEANRISRETYFTEAGLATAGVIMAEMEDTTIVLEPDRWLSWNTDEMFRAVKERGLDLENNPPEKWLKDLD